MLSKINYKDLITNILVGIILLNLPYLYKDTFIQEYKTGTDKFKEFAKNNIKVNDRVSTDIQTLSWTILPYYFPENEIENNIDERTIGYVFSNEKIEKIQEITKNKKVELIFTGNIDNKYNFNMYYINK